MKTSMKHREFLDGTSSLAYRIEGESVVRTSKGMGERRIQFPHIREVHIGPCDLRNMFVRIRSDFATIRIKAKPIQFDELAGWVAELRKGLKPYWSKIRFRSGNPAWFYSMLVVLVVAPIVIGLSCLGVYHYGIARASNPGAADYRALFVTIGLSAVILVFTWYKAWKQMVRSRSRRHSPNSGIMPYYLDVHSPN